MKDHVVLLKSIALIKKKSIFSFLYFSKCEGVRIRVGYYYNKCYRQKLLLFKEAPFNERVL